MVAALRLQLHLRRLKLQSDNLKDTISQHPQEDEGDTIFKSVLNEIGEQHWTAAGLLATAHVLERQETVNGNREEYLAVLIVLDEIYECVVRLNECNETTDLTKKMKHKMKNLMACMVLASIWCCARTDFSKFSLFLEERITLQMLLGLQELLQRVLGISFVKSISRGDLDNNDESEDESLDLLSEDESDLSSAKASLTAPNVSDDNDVSMCSIT